MAVCSSVDDAVSSEVDDPWGSSNSSLDHSVNKQNSSPTRQISPVRLHTQVGVPLKEISFSSSYNAEKKPLLTIGSKERDDHVMNHEADFPSHTHQ